MMTKVMKKRNEEPNIEKEIKLKGIPSENMIYLDWWNKKIVFFLLFSYIKK